MFWEKVLIFYIWADGGTIHLSGTVGCTSLRHFSWHVLDFTLV